MHLSARVLGATVVTALQERHSAVLLTIGADTFTRAQLARVACWNFVAAANLSKILNRELNVKDTRDVFDHVPPTKLAVSGLGAVSLAVLGAAFEAKKVGGDRPLEAWVIKHSLNGSAEMKTFHTLKAREAKERAAETGAVITRKQARRGKAHRLRVERFNQRQGAPKTV